MISAQSRPFIDASVEVLREHGLAITRTFYSSMFNAHPELTNLFNMGNQASGAQQQSLAAAVFAYAANIDNPDALAPVVKRIVHKHASVGITADHYPIVGRHLLGAIQTVLKDAASPPLLAAWDEAYTALANALISAEKELYAGAGVDAGQLHAMRVTAIEKQSEQVTSFTLDPVEGERLPSFKPGQYVSVSIPLENGGRQLRQYSLSDKPNGQSLRISVKREDAGKDTPAGQISNWIHASVKLGDVIQITHPFGEFTPDTSAARPLVLLSAGVGVTPMISILNTIAATNPQRPVVFAHAARDLEHHPHRRDIAAAREQMPNLQVATFYEAADNKATAAGGVYQGRMQVAQLPQWDRNEADVYMCGPIGFMQEQWISLVKAGVPALRLHREVFGPEMLDYLS